MNAYRTIASMVLLFVTHANLSLGKTTESATLHRDDTYNFAKENSKVEFSAVGNPGFIRIKGTEGHAIGTLTYDPIAKKIDGKLVVAMNDFTTDMSLRDRHMKGKYLEVEKYPNAELRLNSAPLDLSIAKVSTNIPAELTLHGVTKPVTVKANIEKANSDNPHLDGVINILLTDFGIDIPSFAGVTVAKDVEVKVSLDSNKLKDK